MDTLDRWIRRTPVASPAPSPRRRPIPSHAGDSPVVDTVSTVSTDVVSGANVDCATCSCVDVDVHDSVAPVTADSSNEHRPSRSRSRKRGRRLRGKQSCQSGSCASSMRDVSCWEDIAQWPTHNLSTYASDAQSIGWTDALKTYSDNVACTSTISSAFSGV